MVRSYYVGRRPLLSPLTPIVILAAGTLGLLLGLLPRFRYTGLIGVAAAAGALAALLLMALNLPARAMLSGWQPLALFGYGLSLEVDGLSWLFGLGLLVVTLATLLTGLMRAGGRRVGTRVAVLLLTAASLISIFSENLLTRILAWVLLDLVYFLALIFLAEGDGLEPQAVLNLAFTSAGTLLAVGAAVFISRTSDSLSLRDAALTSQTTLLITLAAVFRLGLFPLHLGMPTEMNIRQGLGTLLRLAPGAVALETLSRLAAVGFPDSLRPWLTILCVGAAVVGAIQLWNVDDPRHGLAYVVIAQSGIALLAGLWGGPAAAFGLTATALALLLGAALVYLSNGYDPQRPWPTALPAIGALAMIGAPLTIGFLGVGQLYGGLASSGGLAWLVLLALLLSQVVLAAGLLYTVLGGGQPVAGEPLAVAAYYGGLSLPGILLIIVALLPTVAPEALQITGFSLFGLRAGQSLLGLVCVALTAGGGFALWRFEDAVRDRGGSLPALLAMPLTRLHWLYRLMWGIIRGAGSAISNVARVLEGEGALLWTLVAGLLVWMLIRQ